MQESDLLGGTEGDSSRNSGGAGGTGGNGPAGSRRRSVGGESIAATSVALSNTSGGQGRDSLRSDAPSTTMTGDVPKCLMTCRVRGVVVGGGG